MIRTVCLERRKSKQGELARLQDEDRETPATKSEEGAVHDLDGHGSRSCIMQYSKSQEHSGIMGMQEFKLISSFILKCVTLK